MNLNHPKFYWIALFSLFTVANTAIATNASERDGQSPLKISVSQPIYVSKNNPAREYTFKAPDSKTLSNSEQLTAVGGYKVEVYGNAEDLLLEVRDIEPKAFVKGNTIQVGIFSQQNNAEDMVRKLARAGFWARIVAE